MFPLPRLLARFKHTSVERDKTEHQEASRQTAVMEPPTSENVAGESEVALAPMSPVAVVIPADKAAQIAELRDALRATPNFARAHLKLGLALYEVGQYEEAATALHKASRLGKDAGLSSLHCALAHGGFGCALLAQESATENVVMEFQQVMGFLNVMPDFAPESLVQGLALYRQGRYDAAIPVLQQVLAQDEDGLFGTDPALAHCALGCALAVKNQREAAFAEFRATFRLLHLTGK